MFFILSINLFLFYFRFRSVAIFSDVESALVRFKCLSGSNILLNIKLFLMLTHAVLHSFFCWLLSGLKHLRIFSWTLVYHSFLRRRITSQTLTIWFYAKFLLMNVGALFYQTNLTNQSNASLILKLWQVIYCRYSYMYYSFILFTNLFPSQENIVIFSQTYFGSLSCLSSSLLPLMFREVAVYIYTQISSLVSQAT